jgi:hypothetical protein
MYVCYASFMIELLQRVTAAVELEFGLSTLTAYYN